MIRRTVPLALLFVALLLHREGAGGLRAQEAPTPDARARVLLGQPATVYRERRMALMRELRKDADEEAASRPGRPPQRPLVVLRGADDPDIEARFRQANDFAYLTGVDVPGATLVLDPKEQRETLYLPPASPHGGTFVEARPGPGEETARALGIERVKSTAELLADLFAAIADPMSGFRGGGATLYVRGPEVGHAPQGPEARLVRLLRDGAPRTGFQDLRPVLARMRKVKGQSELALLHEAIHTTGLAFDAAIPTLRPGAPEYELLAAVEGTFLKHGAERPGFPSIIASGPNATIPHYFGTKRMLAAGDLVVLDIGAECRLYTADITRTYPVDGTFTPRQRELYELVLAAQKAAEAEMKPGQHKLGEMTRFVREFLDRSPLRAKDEAGEEHTMGHFFAHGLGHYLGMDVHDVGSISEPVQVGEVFTIEPGLYIKSENIGIRIEDDYLMTADGPVKLSAAIPSAPDELERRIAELRAPGRGSPAAAGR